MIFVCRVISFDNTFLLKYRVLAYLYYLYLFTGYLSRFHIFGCPFVRLLSLFSFSEEYVYSSFHTFPTLDQLVINLALTRTRLVFNSFDIVSMLAKKRFS